MAITEFLLGEPEETRGRENDADETALRHALLRGVREREGEYVLAHVGAPVAAMPPLSAFEVEREADGTVVVADRHGAAYGTGESIIDALATWEAAAREHLVDLQEHEAQLHPRLVRQLQFLRGVFG